MTNYSALPPILSCEESANFEEKFFAGDNTRVAAAMQKAGEGLARGILQDFEEVGGFPRDAEGNILVLAGKGHNAGDALIAAGYILERYPDAAADILLLFPWKDLRENTEKALRSLMEQYRGRVREVGIMDIKARYALCVDGVFGYQFRGELPENARDAFSKVSECSIRMRASVDLPSGTSAKRAFVADFTYATGIVKEELLELSNAGRLRFLDIGFFAERISDEAAVSEQFSKKKSQRIITETVLDDLRGFRPASISKREKGHLIIIGGSLTYPGAVLMSVRAALRSGVGLVSVFLPGSLVPAFSAAVPEAIWLGCPESASGGISSRGWPLFLERSAHATAMLVGPGLGVDAGVTRFAREIIGSSNIPMVIDASALQANLVQVGKAPRILTPHIREFDRINGGLSLERFSKLGGNDMVTVLKGPVTSIATGKDVYHSFFGGPVLSRGGSGDILAGMIAGLLAQNPKDLKSAAIRGTAWHGLSADYMARDLGQEAVVVTDMLKYMSKVLRKN